MKLPISWLADWVQVDAAPETIADALTRRGFYVEGVEQHGHSHPGVVVARVLEVSPHPNADRLRLCRVDGGQGEVRVVCGAPNVHAGMIAPLATIGAKLPGGVVIKASKIRGEASQGMLCSARELELAEDADGILDLAQVADGRAAQSIGRPLDELLGPPEHVLEIETSFNRPDGLGIVGLAREVRAAFGGAWTETARTRLGRAWSAGTGFDLELEDADGCPRYIAQAIEGVRIAPSPPWLQRRLESMGQRPINNVVDATNYVLFEFGQPLHAFDLDRLQGPAIRVRRARPGETLTTLDGKARTLDPEVLVIADRERPVAVAGVMGGADSEVTEASTRLLLECAWFDPRRVRRGAKALQLATEASKRYERGVDPEIGRSASARFVELLRESAPGLTLGAGRDLRPESGAQPMIELRSSRCTRLIGLPVAAREAAAALRDLEFEVQDGDPLRVAVPSWRVDVTLEDDLVEEVARSVGYDKIPLVPLETGGSYARRGPRERSIEHARRAMLARGLDEALTSVLVSEREAVAAAALLGDTPERLVRLANPMSREGEVLRPNPLPGLLRACAHNLRQGSGSVRLFEIGSGFRARPEGERASTPLPEEATMLAAIVCGARFAHGHTEDGRGEWGREPLDFDDAKGLWEAWLEEIRVDTPQWRTYSALGWKPGASAEVASRTSRIGWAGMLSQPLLRQWDIEAPAYAFVALLEPLQATASKPRVTEPGRFPPVRRDLAFYVPANVAHADLERALVREAGERLGSIELFDVYTGPGTPQGMKSMAYALQFQHPERTMTEAEVQSIQDRMVSAVATECGGRLRER